MSDENLARTAIAALLRDRPGFHGAGGEAHWDASPRTLEAIAAHVRPGGSTLETGCGASTVVFAACGSRHVVITPDPEEYQRVTGYCARIGVPTGGLTHLEGSSDAVLPQAPEDPLDVALIDGAHSFPFPAVDFHYVSRRLRVGGVLILDDVFIPSVGVVDRFLATSDDWVLLGHLDDQAAVYRIVREPPPYDYWRTQGMNRQFPDHSFLPWRRRARIAARRAAAQVVRQARARTGRSSG